MKTILFSLLLIFQFFCRDVLAQLTDTTTRIDGLYSRWNNATPGVSIAVSQNGKIIYQKAFGLADLEHAVPVTTETIFECGSVSKQFTAMSILLLAQERKLKLDEDVHKYVPELPGYDRPILIQYLLNHTSGLKDWGSIGALAGWPRTTKVYTQELALQIICRQKSTNYTPGNEYSYSNTNYTLLSIIVERISGMPLEEFTRIRFFEPLGMTKTSWRSNFRKIIPGRSIAYSSTKEGYEQLMPFENIYGHGGMLTTTSDLLKWNALLENHSIGGAEVYKERIKKGKLNNGTEINYASGLVNGKLNGFYEISHSGATAGYRGWLAYYPEKKLSIALLSNDGSFSANGEGTKLANIFLGKAPLPPALTVVNLKPEDLKKFQGTFRSIRHFNLVTLEYKDGKIFNDKNPLIPIHSDTLGGEGIKWIFLSPDRIMSKEGNDTLTFRKVSPPDLQASTLKQYSGNYFSDEANVEFVISMNGNNLQTQIKPSKPFSLRPSFLNGFYSDNDQLFEFTRTKQGVVTGLQVSQSRAEHIVFIKTSKSK